MKKIIFVFVLVLGLGVWLWYSDKPVTTTYYGKAHPVSNNPAKLESNPLPPINAVTLGSKCKAQDNGKLPDPTCTPGAVRTTDKADICSTKTSTLRPSTSYTNKLKLEQIADYGYTDTNPAHYEEDHLISLTLGGDPKEPKNLWPEFGGSPNPKDKIENQLHRDICSGKITVEYAQKCIATDWTKCYGN